MATLQIGDRQVQVDDSFLKLAPDQQNATVDEIAHSMGVGGAPAGNDIGATKFTRQGTPEISITPRASSNGGAASSAPAGSPAQLVNSEFAADGQPAPQAPPPQSSGVLSNIAAGANDAIYTGLGAPVDLARGAENLVPRALNAVAGTNIPLIPPDTVGGKEWIEQQAGKISPALNPENTTATTPGEQIARSAGGGLGLAVVPESALAVLEKVGVMAPELAAKIAPYVGRTATAGDAVVNATAGASAGAGAEAAQQAAPEPLKPLAGVVGGLASGAIGLGASQIPRSVAAGYQGVKDAVAPLTEAGQKQLAAAKVQGAATSPAAAADAIENALAQIVPGSQPTTFQQTGDMGLGGLEREAQTKAPVDFTQRAAEQNAAQVGTLKGIQEEGAPEQVAQAFRQRLDQIDQDTQATVDSAAQKAHSAAYIMSGTIGERATGLGQAAAASSDAATAGAQGAAQAIGLGLEPEAAGAAIRSGLESARADAKTQERQLWNAVDPDGTLALAPTQTKTMATQIAADLPVSAGPMGAAESAVHDVIAQYGDAVPLREMSALRTRIGEQISAEKTANNGVETSLSRRLGMLYHAVGDDLQNAVAAKVENESQAVAQGQLPLADTTAAKLQQNQDEWLAQRSQSTRAYSAAVPSEVAGGSARTVPGVQRTESAPGIGLRDAAQHPGVPQSDGAPAGVGAQQGALPTFPQPPAPKSAKSLLQFLRSRGGLRPDPDLNVLFGGNKPDIIRKNGMGLDHAREAAVEAGYLQDNSGPNLPTLSTENDLLDAIDRESRGSKVYPQGAEPVDVAEARAARDRLQSELAAEIHSLGGDYDSIPGQTRDRTLYIMAQGRDAFDAYEQAVMEENHASQYGAGQEANSTATRLTGAPENGGKSSLIEGAGSVGTTARDAGADDRTSGSTGAIAASSVNFDQAALDRLNAARTATAQRASTFDNKTLGPIRARPSGSAPYNMPAAGVAARVFVPGPKGFETLQTYRQAVTDPAAMDAVQQYAIDRLNNSAMRPDGTLDPARAATFQRQYSDALRAFPELNQRIDAAVTASNAAADAATQTAATTKLTAKMAQAATLPDGTLDPAKLDAWRQKNSAALAQFPDLADKFKDVDSASAALADASANRKAALDAAQKGALGKLIGVTAPEDVTKTVGGLFSRQDAVQQFTNLKTAIGTDADAQQGLRKAIVDYMTGRFVGNTEAATTGLGTIKSDSLQTFVKQNQAALKAAGFSDDEIGTMKAVAADLQRANRSNASVKLPARSNTAQDSVSLLRQIAQATRSHTGMTIEGAGIGGALGSVLGPIGSAVGAAGGAAIGRAFAAARQAGLDSVDKIVADAMLNPGRAKILLQTPLAPRAQMRSWADLGSMYKRATLTGISAASQVQNRNQ